MPDLMSPNPSYLDILETDPIYLQIQLNIITHGLAFHPELSRDPQPPYTSGKFDSNKTALASQFFSQFFLLSANLQRPVFFISPLGVKIAPRGELCPLGVKLSPM
jgi:hypothetical protein